MYFEFQKPKPQSILYRKLNIGDMFFFANGCYIKLRGDESINIYNDSIATFDGETSVEIVDYKIIIFTEE